MIDLNKVSKIGFGAYRTSVKSTEHEKALRLALQKGCNLIDTASNYENGESEELIGKVLSETGTDAFVVTKAGYVTTTNLQVLEQLHSMGKAVEDVVELSNEFKHSIHPDYLDAQLKISQIKLKRKCIDGFLLHSPEYYFAQKDRDISTREYYDRITKAFSFLEEKVKDGTIRYYGVSSNTLGLAKNNATDLDELINAACAVASTNHFKLIQFPFNIIENVPAQARNKEGKTLLDVAKEHGIVTFANRPLNANSPSGILKMVLHDQARVLVNHDNDNQAHAEFFSLIEKQLSTMEGSPTISEFSMIHYIKENWKTIPHELAFDHMFNRSLLSFMMIIFNEDIPGAASELFEKFRDVARTYCLENESERAKKYLHDINLSSLLPDGTGGSLPLNVCSYYLKQGLDHVLVGMRKTSYVTDLQTLF